jgi:hypothetical protein
MMRTPPPGVHINRILGCAAVLHAGLLLFVPEAAGPTWLGFTHRLWVGLATLWFFWPLVLAVHPSKSARRFFVPLLFAAPCVFLWFRAYSSILAPPLFGLPDMIDLNPISLLQYSVSYGSGRLDANKDAKTGRLNLEAYGFGTFTPGVPNFPDSLLKEYRIEVTHVAGCVVDTSIIGHAKGYNDRMLDEIRRRCGDSIVKNAEEEDARWIQSYKDGEKAGRADAQRDLQKQTLAIEVTDPPKNGDDDFAKMLRERYQVELRRTYPQVDPKMANQVFGHSTGYNAVMEEELNRRFGEKTSSSIWSSFYRSHAN